MSSVLKEPKSAWSWTAAPLLGPLGHGLAPELVQHPLEDDQEALAAGVHHAGLFQHGVLVDGVGQGDVALLDGLVQDELDGAVLPGGLGRPAGRQAGDGEDGALGGLHDGLVGGGHAVVQGDGEVGAVGGVLVLQGLGKAPEEQGEDDPGVAPGPPQQGVGVGLGHRAHPGEGLFLQLGGGGGDGHAHVGAGVPVGDREDVKLVDLLLLGVDGCRPVDDHLRQQRSVNGSFHVERSFLMTVWAAASGEDHGIHADIHAADLDAGKALHDIAHLAHDGTADGSEIDAVVHDDVELDGDGVVVIETDLDALGHRLPAQQMDQAVGLGAHRHALDAVAVGGGGAGDVGEDIGADGDGAPVLFPVSYGTSFGGQDRIRQVWSIYCILFSP